MITAVSGVTPDELCVWFALVGGIVCLVAWLFLEFRDAPVIGPDHPEAVTGMDVLERTGVHPAG